MLQTTLSGTARQITRFIHDRVHLLGIGNTNTESNSGAWPRESSPPDAPVYLTDLENLCGYVPIKKITPIIEHPQGSLLLSDGSRWLDIGVVNEDSIIASACDAVLIEADIYLNALPRHINRYRSVGLYVGCQVTDSIGPNTLFISKTSAFGYLDTAWYFSPITRNNSLVHKLQLVRRFASIERDNINNVANVYLEDITSSSVTVVSSITPYKLYAITLASPSTAPLVEALVNTPGALKGFNTRKALITGLASSKAYNFYIVLEDIYGNRSTVKSLNATTLESPTLALDLYKSENALLPGTGI